MAEPSGKVETMSIATIVVLILVILCVGLAARKVIRDRKSGSCCGCGKGGSGCSCGSMPTFHSADPGGTKVSEDSSGKVQSGELSGKK